MKNGSVIDLNGLKEVYESTLGTSEYGKYTMETSYKHGKQWRFGGWHVPYYKEAKYKKIKEKEYLIIDTPLGAERYLLNEPVKLFLNIKED